MARAILDLSVTTTPILPFGACYVIMHKVYLKKKKSYGRGSQTLHVS